MSHDPARLLPQDAVALAARGITESEALRQFGLLADPPGYVSLDRPCAVGDGIERLAPGRLAALRERHARDAASGRVSTFVPASGAATRMFRDLLLALEWPGGLLPSDAERTPARPGAAELLAFVDGLPRFAFHDALAAEIAARGHDASRLRAEGPWRPLLEALLGPDALDYARRPKALIAFHRAAEGVRTAFEEHLVESAALARSGDGRCRLHFTVSPEHREGFEALLGRSGPGHAARLGVRWDVRFSEQSASTDTLALDGHGAPFRDADGALLFRPAGHGALLANLGASGGDLVFLKNVDNVAVDPARRPTCEWAAALLGLASELAESAHALAARLAEPGDAEAPAEAARFLAGPLGASGEPPGRAELAALLERPVRVCGMVPNTGEPGGGPFWVTGTDGEVTRQVVEAAQVSPEQNDVRARATHFNPVFMACALRDRFGRPHDLARFVDERAVIVTRKSAGGRELVALERPGLWNGSMARWNTVFVEVPLTVFNPVKTVLDLLRPEHQG